MFVASSIDFHVSRPTLLSFLRSILCDKHPINAYFCEFLVFIVPSLHYIYFTFLIFVGLMSVYM